MSGPSEFRRPSSTRPECSTTPGHRDLRCLRVVGGAGAETDRGVEYPRVVLVLSEAFDLTVARGEATTLDPSE